MTFIEVEPIRTYSSVTYKSFDGGKMGIYFDPFELHFVVIADSFGNEIMKFLIPKGLSLIPNDFSYLDEFTIIQKFIEIFGIESILEIFLLNRLLINLKSGRRYQLSHSLNIQKTS